MRTPSLTSLAALTLLILGGLLAIGAGVIATRPAPIAPVIAILNVKDVLNGLDEQKEKFASLQKRIDELKEKIKQTEADRTADETRIKPMAAGAAKTAALQAYRDKYFRAGVEREYTERLLAEDEVTTVSDLYTKIHEAAAALAKKNGYHLVLTSDENMPIPTAPKANMDQLSQVINLKRMLYVDPQLSITDEVVQFMNNQFQAGAKP